ncbi:MAG: hypothetical protein WA051_01930 [Minisyncoccia bacterium]
MTRYTKILVIAVAAVMNACSGGGTPTDPGCKVNCNPPVETIDGAITSPANNTVLTNGVVTLSASATSSLIGTIADGNKYVWTANGSNLGTGNNISVSVAPGSYNLCVTVTGKSAEKQICGVSFTRVSNIPVRVAAATLGNQPLFKGIRITISSPTGSVKDSVDVSADGTATFSGVATQNLLALDNVRVVVDDISISRLYWRRQYTVTKAELANGLAIVLIPTTWTTTSGEYAGQTVAIDPAKPFVSDNHGLAYYGETFTCSLNNAQCGVVSWPILPAPIMIMQGQHGGSFWNYTELFTNSDSASLLQARNRLQQLFGSALVRDPNPGEVADNGTGGITVGIDSIPFVGGPSLGVSGVATDNDRNVVAGSILFRNRKAVGLIGGAMSEIMHALGVGHSCGWRSVVAIDCPPGGQTAMEPTVEDVAYFWLLQALRKQERTMNTHFSIVES